MVGTDENFSYYGRGCTPERILGGKVPQPEEFQGAYSVLSSLVRAGAVCALVTCGGNGNGCGEGFL